MADMADTKRPYEITMADKDVATIDRLVSDCGLNSRAALLNQSLTLLKWAVDVSKDGRRVASIDTARNVWVAVDLPALRHVRTQGQE